MSSLLYKLLKEFEGDDPSAIELEDVKGDDLENQDEEESTDEEFDFDFGFDMGDSEVDGVDLGPTRKAGEVQDKIASLIDGLGGDGESGELSLSDVDTGIADDFTEPSTDNDGDSPSLNLDDVKDEDVDVSNVGELDL